MVNEWIDLWVDKVVGWIDKGLIDRVYNRACNGPNGQDSNWMWMGSKIDSKWKDTQCRLN